LPDEACECLKEKHKLAKYLRAMKSLFVHFLSLKSLRAKLICVILLVDCAAVASIGFIIVIKARSATKIEIAASMHVAEMLVPETVRLMQNMPVPLLLQGLDLQFEFVRHVTVVITDEYGKSVPSSRNPRIDESKDLKQNDPPRWFYRLIAPPVDIRSYPIIVHNHSIGIATISSEPNDEVTKAWLYVHDLILAGVVLNILVLFTLIYLFGKVLAPLASVVAGLRDFENRNYAVRIANCGLAEIDLIIDRFNHTATALDETNKANLALNMKILTVQDDERRHIAYELHDEAGGHLFALRASASSLLYHIGSSSKEDLEERALSVLSLTEDVQGINRRVLERLRPTALGRFPLSECIIKLVEATRNSSRLDIDIALGTLRESYGRLVDLTVYRCVQEGVLNAVRHANASHIKIELLEHTRPSSHLSITVKDNGSGLKDDYRFGVGLSAMNERIAALKGRFNIQSVRDGSFLEAIIPIDVIEGQET